MTAIKHDISSLCESCKETIEEILETFEASEAKSGDAVNPEILANAMQQLMDVLKRLDADMQGGARDHNDAGISKTIDISELGDYGFSLLHDLTEWAKTLNLEGCCARLRSVAGPFALWLARHGGELRTLDPIVDALAAIANESQDRLLLEELCAAMGEVIDAVAPSIAEDADNSNPGRPWRMLNLNRGIVATRTHNPAVMESAFKVLVENLPEDAAEFFREGMLQMEALDYPEPVRRVMERHYKDWCQTHTLH
jgi:hypothetical protein